MDTLNILTLFREGGIPLLFIGFLIWQIRYFITELKTWREENRAIQQEFTSVVENHLHAVTEAMGKQQHALDMLAQRIEIACKVSRVFNDTRTSSH